MTQEELRAVVDDYTTMAVRAAECQTRNVALLEENRLLNNILDALERLFEEWKAQRAAAGQEHAS